MTFAQPGTTPGLTGVLAVSEAVPAVRHAPLKKNHCWEVTLHVKSSLTMPDVVPVLVLVVRPLQLDEELD